MGICDSSCVSSSGCVRVTMTWVVASETLNKYLRSDTYKTHQLAACLGRDEDAGDSMANDPFVQAFLQMPDGPKKALVNMEVGREEQA